MKIDIISDTVCPWCFIGKRRLERALAQAPEVDVEIAWHPFQLNPDMPSTGMDRRLYLNLKFGGEARASEVYRTVGASGESENLQFNFEAIRRTPNTLKSHRLIHHAGQHGAQDRVVESLFQAYFFNGMDIGSTDVLAEIAAEAGLDGQSVRDYLSSDADLDLVRNADTSARQAGVNGVPCFIIANQYAISGAQEPEVFHQVFAVANQETEELVGS